MKNYFKIIRGYNAEDYLEIEESELEKALYCFLEKKDSVFSGGAIRGSQIIAIQPDFHRTMGWNRGYKLGSEDFEELGQKGVDKKCNNLLSSAKQRVQYLVSTKQENLIGTNVEIKKIESQVSNEVKVLAESKRIK